MTQPISSDTLPEALRLRCELARKMPVWKRLAMTCEFTQATRMLMLADLCRRFPEASEDELRRRFISKSLTRDEVIAAYGFDPVEENYDVSDLQTSNWRRIVETQGCEMDIEYLGELVDKSNVRDLFERL